MIKHVQKDMTVCNELTDHDTGKGEIYIQAGYRQDVAHTFMITITHGPPMTTYLTLKNLKNLIALPTQFTESRIMNVYIIIYHAHNVCNFFCVCMCVCVCLCVCVCKCVSVSAHWHL